MSVRIACGDNDWSPSKKWEMVPAEDGFLMVLTSDARDAQVKLLFVTNDPASVGDIQQLIFQDPLLYLEDSRAQVSEEGHLEFIFWVRDLGHTLVPNSIGGMNMLQEESEVRQELATVDGIHFDQETGLVFDVDGESFIVLEEGVLGECVEVLLSHNQDFRMDELEEGAKVTFVSEPAE